MDADLILSDERIDDHGRPVPIPPDTPTPAPALTDEETDELTETAHADFVASAADEDEIRADHETFARWYAAVIARAKREERERIETELTEAAQLRARQIAHDQMDRDRGEVYAYRIAEQIATEGRNA